ncbi:hypothetical protein K443DRAFT_126751, partial [Laccaria amethystina LaAM-08-1]
MAANIVGAGLERSLQKTETKKHSRDELDNAPHTMVENHMAPLPRAKRRKAGQVDAPVTCASDPPLKPAAPLPRSHLPDGCWNHKIVWSVLFKDLNILQVHLLFSQEVYAHHKVFLKVFEHIDLRSSMDAPATPQGSQIPLQQTKTEEGTFQEIANPTYRKAQIQPQSQPQDNIMVNKTVDETVDEQDMDVDNTFEKNTSHKDNNENIRSEDDSSDDSTDDCYDEDGNEEEEDEDEEDEDNDDKGDNDQVAQNYKNSLRATTESITLQRMAADDFQDDADGGQHYRYDDEFQQEDADVNHVDQQQLLEAHEIDEQSPSEDERQADAALRAPRSGTPYDNNEDNWFEGNRQPTFNIEGEEPHGLEDQDSHEVPLIQDVLMAHHKKNRSNRPPKRSHLVAAANHHRQVQ